MRKILKLSTLRNRRGLSMLEVAVGTALIAMAVGGVLTYVKIVNDTMKNVDSRASLRDLRSSLVETINSPAAWAQTVANPNNVSLACLKNHTDCTGQGGPISVYKENVDASGNPVILFDATNPNSGFDSAGQPCKTFNAVTGDATCIMSYQVNWKAVCSKSPCITPLIQVTAAAIYKPLTADPQKQINVNRYNATFIRGSSLLNTNENVCTSFGGIYNTTSQTCDLPMAGHDCPPSQVVVGYDKAANTMKCRAPWYGSCPAGQFARAVQPDGTVTCVALNCAGWVNPGPIIDTIPTLDYTTWTADGGAPGAGDGGGTGGGDGGCGGAGAGGGGCGS